MGSGQIYTSTDSGVTWTPYALSKSWTSVASSSDGIKLVATESTGSMSTTGGQIYTSTDSGLTWTARGPFKTWNSVASSSNGRRLVATENGAGSYGSVSGGQIYISFDFGVTWTPDTSNQKWFSIALLPFGGSFFANTSDGKIYQVTGIGQTTTGITGSISGEQYDAVELQYVGNNQFTILNSTGILTIQ